MRNVQYTGAHCEIRWILYYFSSEPISLQLKFISISFNIYISVQRFLSFSHIQNTVYSLGRTDDLLRHVIARRSLQGDTGKTMANCNDAQQNLCSRKL